LDSTVEKELRLIMKDVEMRELGETITK